MVKHLPMGLRIMSGAALVAVLLGLVASPARADEQLILANGDRLTGKVIKREKGLIYFHSQVLGDIIAPENQATIVELPVTPIPPQALAGLPPAPAKPAAPPPPGQSQQPPVQIVPLPQPAPGGNWFGWWWPWWVSRPFRVLEPVVTHWTGKVEFGYDNMLTTTRSVGTTTRVEAGRTIGPDSFQFKGEYLYGSTDGVPNTDQDSASFQWRHQLDARLFTQLTTSYSSDKIQLINDNIEQQAGLGYKLFVNARQTLDVGGGATLQYLDATDIEKGVDYLGNVFQDYTYKINGAYTFSEQASADYSPDRRGTYGVAPSVTTPVSTSARNYDYKFQSSLQGKLTNHLSLNLHFEYDYDNAVLDPQARAEQHISTTVGYAF